MTSRAILFDGYWLCDGPPSGRNVVAGLVAGWSRGFPDDRLSVAYPSRATPPELPAGVEGIPVRTLITIHGLWSLLRLGRAAAGYDAVVAQNFTPLRTPRDALRTTFLHDAIYRTNPQLFTPAERLYLALVGPSIRRADVVATSSEAERDRIAHEYPAIAGRLHAVGLAAPVELTEAPPATETSDDSAEPFILAVGRLNVRKNLRRLIDAFDRAGLPDHRLVIVGAADGRTESAPLVHPRVDFLGRLSDARLAELYRRCDFFVFPSLDEGFGLPLVEAAHFGAPSAASDIAPFREIGTASLLFDPHDVGSIANALERMATHHGRRASGSATRVSSFNWVSVVGALRHAMFPEDGA